MNIIEKLNGKRVLLWGYGREGKSSERFINEHCSVKELKIFEGKQEELDDEKWDIVIKSPGVPAEGLSSKYTSQTELFLEEFRDRTIGITGTKGKSTTSSLLYHVLHDCLSVPVFLVGNIGKPCLDIYDEITSDSVVVFELSCHQLRSSSISPHIGVFLNLYEEHLDYYKTIDKYFEAKSHIALFQDVGDFLYVGSDVPPLPGNGKKILIEAPGETEFELKLRGEHNQFNAKVVYEIARERFSCDDNDIRESMKTFNGLPHRLEYVGKVNGVDYFNDSISTIPEATIQAIRSIKNTKTVLIGGMDRHIDYDILVDFIKNEQSLNYIFSYESGKRIYDEVSGLSCCYYEEDLKCAFRLAKEITPDGAAVVLSPAAASYGYFKNFEERGDYFRSLVKNEIGGKERVSFAFTGDIGFDKYMDKKWEDNDLISPEILSFLHDSDHVVINVEGPLSDASKQSVEGSVQSLLHTMNPAAAEVFKNMHADIWNLNNNHMMDAGEVGVSDTLAEAKKAGALTVGAGMNIDEAARPLFFDEAGGIGIFSVGYRRGCKSAGEDHAGCLLWNEMEIIKKNIEEIKKTCRWCIIIAHGGEEFTSLPSPYVRDRYLEYLKMGADIIVCHHPHVPMNFELFENKAIFYSLGNFIFDTDYQRAQFNTEKGVVLRLSFSPNDFEFEALGILIDRNTEHIVKADLPKIFENVPGDEYEKLIPLSEKAFVKAHKKRQIFLESEKYSSYSESEWEDHFMDEKRPGRVPGECLDFTIAYPLSKKADESDFMSSKLPGVLKYIQDQL